MFCMEKHVMIIENSQNGISHENVNKKSNKFILEGIFTEFDIENRNKRIYTAENFVPVMNNTLLAKKAKLGVVYGEYDHPDIFDVSGKNASHVIESLVYNQKDNRIDGSIALLSTFYGKQARAIIEDGFPLFVSSRAAGVTDNYGKVQLKELFTYDIVLDPGFASARVQPKVINESLGYGAVNEDVNYRIYEMTDADVQRLFNTNKNDQTTNMDLARFEQFLKDELAKSEHRVMEMISNSKHDPEQLKSLLETVDVLRSELNAVNKYLEFLQPKVTTLIEQNSKLVEQNKKLESEINENAAFSNHLASGMKKLNKFTTTIEERLGLTEKFAQYVAENCKASILFSKEIASEQTTISEMLEYVAEHVKNNKEFLEYVAEEVKVTQLFAENTAKETADTQEFLDYVANENYKDQVWLDYVAEKVDGLVKYQGKFVEAVKGSKMNESNSEIAALETPDAFLGIDKEQELVNNIEALATEETTVATDVTVETPAATTETVEATTEVPATTETVETPATTEIPATNEDIETAEVTEVTPTITDEAPATTEETPATTEVPAMDNLEDKFLNKLVKVLATEATGLVIEITPENKIKIQLSGSDETTEVEPADIEEMEMNSNYVESVNAVLNQIKKQKALENVNPTFFNFLNERQIADFKSLDKDDQAKIILTMNESEYYTPEDVLGIIAKHFNDKAITREEEIINNIPEDLKESWNGLDDKSKKVILTESKYFNLKNTLDMHNFWNTRTFAKALKSPEVAMIKENANNTVDSTSEQFAEAFLKAYNNLK